MAVYLILAGALAGWGVARQRLWQRGMLHYQAEELPIAYPDNEVELQPLTALEARGWAWRQAAPNQAHGPRWSDPGETGATPVSAQTSPARRRRWRPSATWVR